MDYVIYGLAGISIFLALGGLSAYKSSGQTGNGSGRGIFY